LQAMQGDFTIILAPTLGPLATEDPCGSGLAREGYVLGDVFFTGVHIHCCGHGLWRFRSYSGSLGKAPSNQGLLPLTFGASPWLGMPSLRSCSVGPPPSAIHGRGRLTRHPCRVAHCAEPPLGLTRGRTPQQRPRRPTGRPGCWVRSSVRYMSAGRPPSRVSSLPQVLSTSARFRSAGRPSSRASPLPQLDYVQQQNQVGCQAAFAGKPAPTEEQRQIGVHPRFSPLIRPSVSSPAALDLDPPAPSEG